MGWPAVMALLLGLLVGIASGMVGIGGGALLIPALMWLYSMPQVKAQGTALATMLLPIGFFACWRYYKAGHVDVRLALLLAAGFAVGGWFGGGWAQHVPVVVLRRGLAAVLFGLALRFALMK